MGQRTRVLIYSHDSFGLGHLRRCRTLAHALVERRPDVSVLIITGSPIAGSFDYRNRVDFVRVPGVIKLSDGAYVPLSLDMDIDETVALRARIIRHTAEAFDPNLMIVDKEPLGLRGEVLDTLESLKARGTPLVLGLRDVMDEPEQLATEWARKNVLPALIRLYDDIWVYGMPQLCDPLAGLDLPAKARRKVKFTGYLRRSAPVPASVVSAAEPFADQPFLLATAGGGGDGENLVDWVLGAYELDPVLPYPALIVFGPFMQAERQSEFTERAARLDRVQTLIFDANMETLMARAAAVVAMGGYNTFCEILSFDKRALLVPRTTPRLEQFIRVSRAEELGLVRMLADDGRRAPVEMAAALRALPSQPPPSRMLSLAAMMDGLENVNRFAGRWLDRRQEAPLGLRA